MTKDTSKLTSSELDRDQAIQVIDTVMDVIEYRPDTEKNELWHHACGLHKGPSYVTIFVLKKKRSKLV